VSGKRAMDLAIGVPLAAATLLMMPIVALANRLTGDPGPLLYRAIRVGKGGRPIAVLKFRTMVDGIEGGPLTSGDDPRVTRVGRVLRRRKIDELPQLFNVLRGEMSLVGPRPEDPAFVDWSDPLHARVFSALPGITGPSQLAYLNEEDLHRGVGAIERYRREILPRKLQLDRRYVEGRTLRLDAWILLKTLIVVARGAGRRRRQTAGTDR
jgi:lipopolysaccharide/colanic/teichoic acid biosynthesis glycosyltransferase